MSKKRIAFLHDPRFHYGSVSTILLCLCLAALVALNSLFTTLEKRNGWRVDCSFNALTTQSETTKEILAALTAPVHIYAVFERGQEDQPLLELLDRYAAASPLVTWEQASASLNPMLLARFAEDDSPVTSDCLIVHCEATGRYRVLQYDEFLSLSINYDTGSYERVNLTYESAVTSAIAYVTKETIPVVYVVQGHDELDEEVSAVFAALLTGNHYDVRYAALGEITLNPADLLVFLSPVRDLTSTEFDQVTAFTAAGGSVLFTCDYSDPIAQMPNYQSLLRAYGFVPLEGVVVASRDEPGTYFESNRTVLLPAMVPAETTLDLMLSGSDVLVMSTARAFETPAGTDSMLRVQPILTSGDRSYLRTLSGASTSLEQQPGDATGPFTLGLEAYRFSAAGDVSRAVMLGSSTLLTSDYYHAMSHGQEFIIRLMDYLLGGETTNLNIMAKPGMRPQLSAESVTMGSLLLTALPLSVLAAAFLILYPRRHL